MALTSLMLEKDINTITVFEITELADVNRVLSTRITRTFATF
jgi:hypothetical protein